MALQVTLINKPGTVSDFETSQTDYTFDTLGGTLGRSPSNTWTLPDPDRFLSSCHCEILFADNQFYIVDLSTNGTFLNGSPEPLGKGVKAALADGDSFEIGDYRFSVKLITDNPQPSSSPFDVTSTQSPFARDSSSSPFADPFASPTAGIDDFSLSPDSENSDPLLALDSLGRSNVRADSNDIFGGDQQPVGDPFAGMGQVDQSPGMDQAVSWPESAQQNLIPDDWEEELLGSAGTADSAPASMEPSPAPQSNAPTHKPEPLGEVQAEFGNEAPVAARPVAREAQVESPPPRPAPAPEPAPISPKPAAAPIPPVASNGHADRRFVAAMGLDAEALSEEQVAAISETAGAVMREIVEGMMQVLRSRTSIKNEFRMNVTTIEPFENNPLKFSVGVDEALENMFIKSGKAYKAPLEAFQESFQEIGEHQLAMIAGIRVGFEKMLSRFDPATLQEIFNRQGKGSAIPGVQKAKYWNSYREYYQGFSDKIESSFQNLFGSDFVQAYEDQLRKLAVSRKKK